MEVTFALESLEQLRAAGAGECYESLERPEHLRLFTARVQGQLVGYCAYFVKHNPHYKSSLQALQDLLVMLPERAPALADLLAFAEQCLAAEGVQVIYQSELEMRPLLESRGYERVDTIWRKSFDRS